MGEYNGGGAGNSEWTVDGNGNLVPKDGEPVSIEEARTKTHPVVDVTHPDFGAVGDGVTDDTQAFRDAAASDRTLYVPATSDYYRITGEIDLSTYSNLTVVGDGRASMVVQEQDGPNGFYANGGTDLAFRNLGLTGANVDNTTDSPTAIYVEGTDGLTVENCVIADWGYDGITALSGSENIIIRGNHVMNSHDDGINPGGSDPFTNDVTVVGNIVENCGADGLHLSRYTRGLTCAANVSRNNGRYGIMSTGISDNKNRGHAILGNTVYGNGDFGVYLTSTKESSCIGNVAEGRVYGYRGIGCVMAGNVQTVSTQDTGFGGGDSEDNVVALNITAASSILTQGANSQSGLNVTGATF